MELDEAIDQLTSRLAHYPPERYPVQHATTQFHLGQALLQRGRVEAAVGALRISMQLFPEVMRVERAKVLNLLGAALREQGHLEMAAAAFTAAGEVFAEQDLASEHGAALFNLGLVQRDSGQPAAAAGSFALAQARFAAGPHSARAAAAVHRGKALLEAGQVDDATRALVDAVELAERVGDHEGIGAATNALGLAHHAAGQADAAVAALRRAVASHPRSVRPAEYAMAKANLSLAYEAAARPAHARLAALQAITAAPPPPVREQAESLFARLGPLRDSDLFEVLDSEPEEGWAVIMREEVARWAAAPAADRDAAARSWVQGVMRRQERSDGLLHVWLSALIELPPDDLTAITGAVLAAGRDADADLFAGFYTKVDRATAWFPLPQMLRLRDLFDPPGPELDQEAVWSPPRT